MLLFHRTINTQKKNKKNQAMISQEHLAVKIALLSLVNDLPGQEYIAKLASSDGLDDPEASRAESNDLAHVSGNSRRSKRLSLKYELFAAQHLAFISAYSSNPRHVMAVSCHEVQGHASRQTGSSDVNDDVAGQGKIMIRVAANTGTHDALIQHLRVIAKILEKEAADGRSHFKIFSWLCWRCIKKRV